MRHMLDTNIVSYIVRKHPDVLNKYSYTAVEDICISSVTEAELLYGVAKKQSTSLTAKILEFLNTVTVFDWDREAAESYGRLRASMEKEGKVMGALDQLLAAHAVSRGATFVTNDRAFAMVQGLNVEDWTASL